MILFLLVFNIQVLAQNNGQIIKEDKVLHYSVGYITYDLAERAGVKGPIKYVMLVGTTKELYDHYNGGSVEFEDIVATFLGGMSGHLISIKF